MASTKRHYNKEEIARRGDAVYETDIRPHLSPEDDGMLVAIDIDSGAYVLDVDELKAFHRLRQSHPDAGLVEASRLSVCASIRRPRDA